MTAGAIEKRMQVEKIIHDIARQMVETLTAAKASLEKLGADEDEAAERIMELVTGDDE